MLQPSPAHMPLPARRRLPQHPLAVRQHLLADRRAQRRELGRLVDALLAEVDARGHLGQRLERHAHELLAVRRVAQRRVKLRHLHRRHLLRARAAGAAAGVDQVRQRLHHAQLLAVLRRGHASLRGKKRGKGEIGRRTFR